jgi:hypothetical protein
MRSLCLILLLLPSLPALAQAGLAEGIFAARGPAVVQVRVIDQASGDKAAIGSGFQVDAGGLLATNFHVIAEVAHEPARYHLEYLDADGTAVPLELLDVDVIHDLALLRTAQPLAATVPLAGDALAQGERVYSIGNPLDLAMTIIEGTYNGMVDAVRYRKILFSASLNPGMSGGPALNAAGELVGVNVARGGEQISFLVPAEYLAALLGRADDERRHALPIEERIGEALLADQDAYFGELLAVAWRTQPFAGFRVPGKISPTMKCWGGSDSEPEDRYDHVYQECASEDTVFLEDDLETGSLRYVLHGLSSRGLNTVQFYGLLRAHFQHHPWFNAASREQVSNFRCREDFLRGRGTDWRVSFCARGYRRFPQLFDVSVAFASTELPARGLVGTLAINGVSESRARVLLRRFLESIEWQP